MKVQLESIRSNYYQLPGGGFKNFFCSPTPTFGNDPVWHGLTKIFQMGWLNHQPEYQLVFFLFWSGNFQMFLGSKKLIFVERWYTPEI